MLIVSAAVVQRGSHIMLCQRKPDVHNGLKWEFPGGKLEQGETPEQALRRELQEELSIDTRVGRIMDAVLHRYPDRDVLVLFYRCEILSGEPRPVDCNAVAWALPADLPQYDFAGADQLFVHRNFSQKPSPLGEGGTAAGCDG